MRLEKLDNRTNRGILLDIERRLAKLERRLIMDLYDRIIAGVAAIQSGDTAALSQHVAAIDTHLSAIDAEDLQLEGDDTGTKNRLGSIEAGLAKIADAVSPVATPTPAPASTGTDSTAA